MTCTADLKWQDGTLFVTFLKPEALATCEVEVTSTDCCLRYRGITVRTPEILLPDSACVSLLHAVLTAAAHGAPKKEGQQRTLTGATQNGLPFVLTKSSDRPDALTVSIDREAFTVQLTDLQPLT